MFMRIGMIIVPIWLFVEPTLARDLNAAEKKLIADTVAKDFKDPPAARFRWLPINPENTGVVSQNYCGMVNGKNSYGAYTGFVPFLVFVATKNGKVIIAAPLAVADSDSSMHYVMKTCLGNGMDPREAQ